MKTYSLYLGIITKLLISLGTFMITIKDIAKEANVSEGTVDRVLHNRGGVSQKTEEKIKAIFKKHNFKVNPVASALALKNKLKIATLIPSFDKENLFWKSPYLGILKATNEVKSFGVETNNYFFNQFDPNSYLNQFKILIDSNPSAVIIVPTFKKETKHIVEQLEQQKIPYLFLNIDLNGFNNIAFIGQDSYTGGYVAGKLMHLSLGDQSSSLIIHMRMDITNYYSFSKRIEGFKDFFIKNGINTDTQILSIDNLNDVSENKEKINSFLKANENIKGIFVPSSRISNVVNYIEDTYLNKIELIGFDNTPQNIECLVQDKISFLISQKSFDQGFESIRLMTDFLINKKVPEAKIYSPIDILTKENAKYNERNEIEFEIENSTITS